MARICLISPGHLSTNPRLVKEADALHEDGHDVQVIAADFIGWARHADNDFLDRPWQLAARLPFGPNAHLWRRCVHGVRQRSARVLWRRGVHHPRVLRAAWHPIAPDLAREACRIKADLYIAHYPAALPASALAAAKNQARYAYDAEDFHLGDPPESADYDDVRDMTRAIESLHLPGCSYVSAASPGIAEAYQLAYGIPLPTVILNVFPLADAPKRASMRGSARLSPSVYWFSQTIGADRGLECAAKAIGLARSSPHLYLQGNVRPAFREELLRVAGQVGAAGRIHFLPPVRPAALARVAAAFDVGFVGETGQTPNRRIALTNKLFTYWLAGVPCVASDIPAHRALAAEVGPAMACFPVGNSQALAMELDSLLSFNSGRLAEARQRAWQLSHQRFNWDMEKSRLIRCVSTALQS